MPPLLAVCSRLQLHFLFANLCRASTCQKWCPQHYIDIRSPLAYDTLTACRPLSSAVTVAFILLLVTSPTEIWCHLKGSQCLWTLCGIIMLPLQRWGWQYCWVSSDITSSVSIPHSMLWFWSTTDCSALDRLDPIHCNSLLTTGRWLDNAFKNWQPDGVYSSTNTRYQDI